MSETTLPCLHYPNKMGRIILLSLEEVLGRSDVTAILNQAGLYQYIESYPDNTLDLGFQFEELSKINQTLEEIYGVRGGRGIALRAGRASFKYGLREFGPRLGVTDLAFRLMPLEDKLKTGAGIFAGVFNQYSDQQVRVEAGTTQLLWHIERCPVCWRRKTEGPACHLTVGILQELLLWISGGKYYKVEEIACVAKGDKACTFLVEKSTAD